MKPQLHRPSLTQKPRGFGGSRTPLTVICALRVASSGGMRIEKSYWRRARH
jgi:hypothetical protein